MFMQNPHHTTCLPDVVQDGKIKGEMKTDNDNRSKLDVTSFKTLLKGRRAGSLPSQTAFQELNSQQIKENISNDESAMEPHCKLSYSMSECNSRQDVFSVQKESLNIFDPLLGAILEPIRKVQYLELPTLNRAPNLKKKIITGCVPDKYLTSTPKLKRKIISDSLPDKDLTSAPKLKKEIISDSVSDKYLTSTPKLKRKIISDSVPDLHSTSLDTEPEERQDSASIVTEPEPPKHSSSPNSKPDQRHSTIPENIDMMIFTPRSKMNDDIEMINSSYKLGNEKSEKEKIKEAKEKCLLLQQVRILQLRIALQKEAINDLKRKESMLEEKLKDESKIQQALYDELDEFEEHCNKERLKLNQMDRTLLEIPEKRRYEAATNLLILTTIEEEKKELRSRLTDREKEFSALLNNYEAIRNIINSKGYEINIKNLENAISERKKKIKQWNENLKCFEDHIKLEVQGAKNQIEAEKTSHKMECLRLTALLKKHELKINSLESALRMKLQEQSDLTQIFHDLTKTQNMTPCTEVEMYDRSGSLL